MSSIRRIHITKDCTVEFYTVEFDVNKDELFEEVLKWFLKHEAFDGETIYQCDEPRMEAPELLTKIAEEIFQFKVIWKE